MIVKHSNNEMLYQQNAYIGPVLDIDARLPRRVYLFQLIFVYRMAIFIETTTIFSIYMYHIYLIHVSYCIYSGIPDGSHMDCELGFTLLQWLLYLDICLTVCRDRGQSC